MSPGAGVGARTEQDQIVGAGAEHDVLRLDAGVVGDRTAELAVAAGRVAADARERARDRAGPRRRQRQRRRVLVEAQHLRRVDACQACDLVGRRRPGIRRELGRERSHRCTAAACAGMPSAAASASTVGRMRARPASVRRLHRHRLQERLEAEPSDRPCPAVRRQHVVAAGRVVAGGHRRPRRRRRRSRRCAPSPA